MADRYIHPVYSNVVSDPDIATDHLVDGMDRQHALPPMSEERQTVVDALRNLAGAYAVLQDFLPTTIAAKAATELLNAVATKEITGKGVVRTARRIRFNSQQQEKPF